MFLEIIHKKDNNAKHPFNATVNAAFCLDLGAPIVCVDDNNVATVWGLAEDKCNDTPFLIVHTVCTFPSKFVMRKYLL